jgi:DNA-directed RNA polymerase specialized sigma24 family protein
VEEVEFATLFREEYPAVVRTAYLILGDRQAAEDVAQEAFTRLVVHWRKVSRYERPGAWVRRVAIRLALRADRRRRTRTAKVEPGPTRFHSGGAGIRDAILALPPKQRAAIVLHYYEDRPVREVAEFLGCATATARVHLHRARRRLSDILREEATDAGR